MDVKSTLKAITLELRHELEGKYDAQGTWQPGDLERRLAAIGVRRDRAPVPVDELSHLAPEDREARRVVDAFLQSRAEAGQNREAAIAEFVRDAAYEAVASDLRSRRPCQICARSSTSFRSSSHR